MIAMRWRSLAIIGCLLTVATAHAEGDARNWLVRMSAALTERNYDGRFIHSNDTQSENLRIVHRNVGGKITERLVSLDGSGREYIRTNTNTTYYIPDTRTTVVEDRMDNEGLLTLIPEYRAGLENYYDITAGSETMVLGRRSMLVTVQPRDEYRYGYRLWLDAETAMPLKSQLFNHHGKIVEQVAFAELAMKDSIPDIDLQTRLNTTGYSLMRNEVRRHFVPRDSIGWRVGNLPPGFKLKLTRLQYMAGSKSPVRHMVYTDGLATVSVFIEPANSKEDQGSGLQRVGSVFAFHADNSGYQITAVGEVPSLTVKSIVGSLSRDDGQFGMSASANAAVK
jgi:sigma-E factor negative regulatory protein RseB